jgi:hypothetical protein
VTMVQYPHCDQHVLHAPGACEFCDMYPDMQQDRVDRGVNFTGETDPTKLPCPAWARRGSNCQVWAGNTPYKSAPCVRCGKRDRLYASGLCLGCELGNLEIGPDGDFKVIVGNPMVAKIVEPRCECGAAKVGGNHSGWCPLNAP